MTATFLWYWVVSPSCSFKLLLPDFISLPSQLLPINATIVRILFYFNTLSCAASASHISLFFSHYYSVFSMDFFHLPKKQKMTLKEEFSVTEPPENVQNDSLAVPCVACRCCCCIFLCNLSFIFSSSFPAFQIPLYNSLWSFPVARWSWRTRPPPFQVLIDLYWWPPLPFFSLLSFCFVFSNFFSFNFNFPPPYFYIDGAV